VQIKVLKPSQGRTGCDSMGQVESGHAGAYGVPGPDLGTHGGSAVKLNVYDLGEEWLRVNDLFSGALPIGGAFHAGLEVHGLEWSFGREGISCSAPRANPNFIFRETVELGFAQFSSQQVAMILYQEMSPYWNGHRYDVLKKNCCNFCRKLSKRLCGNDIPGWVDRFAKLGRGFGLNSEWLEGQDEDELCMPEPTTSFYPCPHGPPPMGPGMHLPAYPMQPPLPNLLPPPPHGRGMPAGMGPQMQFPPPPPKNSQLPHKNPLPRPVLCH